MSEHRVTVSWHREGESFDYEAYNREHTWSFDGGVESAASLRFAHPLRTPT